MTPPAGWGTAPRAQARPQGTGAISTDVQKGASGLTPRTLRDRK